MTCEVNGCTRDALCKAKNARIMVCGTHYNQDWAGKPFSPIRTYMRVIKTNHGKQCSTCELLKPWSEFYYRTGGQSFQNECKTCMGERSRRNLARRTNES